jgi:hypothetical protein
MLYGFPLQSYCQILFRYRPKAKCVLRAANVICSESVKMKKKDFSEVTAHVISTILTRPISPAELESGLRTVIGHRDSEILYLCNEHICAFLNCAASFRRALRRTRANGGRQSIDRALTLTVYYRHERWCAYLVLAVMWPHVPYAPCYG